MTRSLPEWIATHDDQPIPPRIRLRIFERHQGRCAKCSRLLRPGHWDCDHIKALINGGKHRERNLQPLCDVPCHGDKTKDDQAEKSKSYKRRLKHAGVKRRRRTIPGRRFDGTPIQSKWVVK